MYINFEFEQGNPYIAMTNKALWGMVKKYYLEQTDERSFKAYPAVHLTATPGRKISTREKAKVILSQFAKQWQFDMMCNGFNYSYDELASWQDFFTEYGKKYGLLREFKENGIC